MPPPVQHSWSREQQQRPDRELSRRIATMRNSAGEAERSRSTDSWVEIRSQPSSASLAGDQVLTAGSNVGLDAGARPTRRHFAHLPPHLHTLSRAQSTGGNSSQEEYEESESESERVMTSSNEGLVASQARHSATTSESAGDDDDDGELNADGNGYDESTTAPGVGTSLPTCFTPQPNAFSHPPQGQSFDRDQAPNSYFPTVAPSRIPARATTSQRRQAPYAALDFSQSIDHDAALRASLNTLLSCAAAARGHPKTNPAPASAHSRPSPAAIVEPSQLRLVRESALPTRSNGSASSRSSDRGKGKRKAGTSKAGATKKARHLLPDDAVVYMSPTLLTWVVSAGVLVLVSALGFSAGYVVGKEAGEASARVDAFGVAEGGCGREVVKGGLRRLRWGTAAGAVQV